MQAGYLHLECRRGLRADLVNAALMSLLFDRASVKKNIDALGIADLNFDLSECSVANLRGHSLHIILGGAPIEIGHEHALAKNIFADHISLADIKRWLSGKPLSVSVMAISQKILEQLTVPLFSEQKLTASDALWLVCQSVIFSALIDALDPKYITATKICLSENRRTIQSNSSSIFDPLWVDQLLINMPAIEVDDDIHVDVVGLAFIKTLAAHVGARGESRIHKIGLGVAAGASVLSPIITEALWCEASLPDSMAELGSNNYPRLDSLYEIVGTITANHDVQHIASSLSLHGALSITWNLAQREKNASCYIVRFLVRDEDKRDATEAFLIKGHAHDVRIAVVERLELNKRLVSVPIGTGNKASAARFFEYIYLDKIVRVEPVKEDLDLYVQKTDYSVDVARSDLMLAWKKWRGRVVFEDA